MKCSTLKFLFLFLFFTGSVTCALAQFAVSPIFSSNMVLQRGTAVPVFGTASPGATVTVQFQSQSKSGVANSSGKWRIDLASMTASSTPSNLVVTSGTSTVTFTGVQVGEVWLCSGQSNMGWSLSSSDGSAPYISSAGNHNIRLFRMTAGNGPSTTTWQVSNSSTAGSFSGVGYWMGLELSQWFGNVPIGLIQATHDGTAIETWQHTSGGTGADYDAMVKSIQPFAIKGVAWYQGESNGGDAAYASKLTNMINEWRTDWGVSSLPFGIIQLAYRSGWNACRNAQLEVADSQPNCFLVVIRDLAGGALHPTDKRPVGIRTAIGARGLVYGDNITYSGSIRDIPNSYASGNKIILNWKHLGNGLFTSDGLAPGEFKVATATGQFKTATAVIVGNTVEVSNATVTNPTRVQYSYSSVGNLYTRVNVLTEGGTVTVNRLKVSEFEINVAVRSAGAAVAPNTLALEAAEKQVSVYPNPTNKGRFSISLGDLETEGRISIRIADTKGRTVFESQETAQQVLTVNSRLKPGIYVLQVRDQSKLLVNRKLVVQ
jgi:sialate O-acetylesterase